MSETWTPIKQFTDLKFERTEDGIAKITINRPEVRNAFRPQTVAEMKKRSTWRATTARSASSSSPAKAPEAFCSGGDQRVRGKGGYVDPKEKIPRLNILDVQKQIRSMPKPVVAMVAGYAIGGGHVLHVVCDLTIAADNARFGQTGPRVGSFDARPRLVVSGAHRRPEESARDLVPLPAVRRAAGAARWGSSTRSSRWRELEEETLKWCREMLALSPMALRFLKAAMNADCDGQIGLLDFGGDATLALLPVAKRRRKGATRSSRSGSPTSGSSRDSRERRRWLLAARPKTLSAAVVPVLVGAALVAAHDAAVALDSLTSRARWSARAVHPDRDELHQRRARLQEGRGHRRAPRADARDAGGAAQRRRRDARRVRLLRRWPRLRRSADRARRLADAGRSASRRSRGVRVHGRAVSARVSRTRRAVRHGLLRLRGRRRHVLRADAAADALGIARRLRGRLRWPTVLLVDQQPARHRRAIARSNKRTLAVRFGEDVRAGRDRILCALCRSARAIAHLGLAVLRSHRAAARGRR